MATFRNIFILIICICCLIFYVLPYIMYILNFFDRYYLGLFNEKDPFFAKTTVEIKYYKENNIPYVTIDDIKYDHETWK